MANRHVDDESPFYSSLGEALQEAQGAPKLADPQKWKEYLDGLQRRGVIRKEEREDTGIDKYLDSHPSHLSRHQLVDHVEKHRPKLKVQVPGGGEDEHLINEHMDDIVQDLPENESAWDEVEREAEKYAVAHPGDDHGFRSFHSFKDEDERAEFINEFTADSWGWFNHWIENKAKESVRKETQRELNETGGRYSQYQMPGGQNYKEHVVTVPSKGSGTFDANKDTTPGMSESEIERRMSTGASKEDYASPHWDEPNILVHYRSNERDVNGKRSLHLEEVQSDWHQEGREEGYSREDAAKKIAKQAKLNTDVSPSDSVNPEAHGRKEYVWNAGSRTVSSFGNTEEEARKDLVDWLNRYGSLNHVPDAPHKKSWPLLAIKHAIYRAAKEGHSRISWTPGEEVQKLVGGNLAGQKKFYDEILPNIVNDYIKKFGSKVEKGTTKVTRAQAQDLRGQSGGYTEEHTRMAEHGIPVHYFDVTPEMRVAVLHGQPTH